MFLKEGEEVLVARDGQDVAELLAALTPMRARAIGEAGRRRILAGTPMRCAAPRWTRCCAAMRHRSLREPRRMREALDIVVLGLSLSSSWGNGHATTYRALLRAVAARGTASPSWSGTCPGTRRTAICRPGLLPAGTSTMIWRGCALVADHRRGRCSHRRLLCAEGVAVGRLVQEMARGVTAFYDIDTPVTLAKLRQRASTNISRPS
jgi:antitoxin (DNA-binding transcriptional repressor) of toxin-antitoxin stability system